MHNHTLLLGDYAEHIRTLADKSVDLVLTDPPYKMTKTGNSCRPGYMPGGEILDGVIPPPSEWMEQVYRVLKDDTHFYTFCNRNDLLLYLETAKRVGFHFHNMISMIKDTHMPNRWYMKYTEMVLFFKKGRAKAINDKTSRDYALVKMPKGDGKFHPTEKPLDFISKLLTNSSQIGDVVLDPFMGGGTTGVAALNSGRRFIGIEKDATFFSKAQDRIAGYEIPLAA